MMRTTAAIAFLGALVGCGGKAAVIESTPSPSTEEAAEQSSQHEVPVAAPTKSSKTMQAACSAPVIDILDCATDAGYEVNTFRAQTYDDPEVNVIGIYETRSDHRGSDYHPTGEASVHVSRHAKQILVLSSYEPTHWTVSIDPGADVVKIVTLGYYDQPVSFQGPSAPVEHAGFGCGYSWPYNGQGCETNALFAASEKATQSFVAAFAGCYRANTFVVRDDQEICN